MSLACEGDGASCVECGEFDFLPYTCPYCHGVFCAAHASCHHNPTSPDTESSAVLCVRPDPVVKEALGAVACIMGDAAPASQARCVVCRSFPCALTPCPQCGESFCAAHRFHGHEDAALQERLRKRAEQTRPSSREGTGELSAGSIGALCAAFTASHPLTLAPVGYRSRRMGLLALVLCLDHRYTASAKSTTGLDASPLASCGTSSLSEGALTVNSDDVGLCSLIVATEMSVGQLRDRLETALLTAPEAALPPSSRAFAGVRTSIFTLASTAEVCTDQRKEERRGLSSQRSSRLCPVLSVVALPSDAVLRRAHIVNATVVLAVVPAGVSLEESKLTTDLCAALSDYFYSADASAHRDDRVKALATRLYLQHQQLMRGRATGASIIADDASSKVGPHDSSAPPSTTATAPARAAAATAVPQRATGDAAETVNSRAATDIAAAATTEALWPFRHAPPLNSFEFFNSKMRPCGVAAIRPPTAPRVVVALFIADATLPCAVRPMCVALGRDWPVARVVDRLQEEVEQQLGPHCSAAKPQLKSFSLYRLVESEGGRVESLWEGAGVRTSASTLPLQNADVLVLCPPESPGALAAIQAELHRLYTLTGNDKRALKADQIKLCSVM
ncbi:hypothetical protein ABL78_3603 [Leptomonas seymouri]|uniref:C2H2-type domain-containing protein n=1 Tax=Leptomonas seymouri TaxID=5684 RepID=A0A0N1PDP2_LEPSE|nr:hypothetical protein ABL78_3603 [Leptomonas seymouri]|eukprot:KPI87320.1 hypothetical protein ABL78_3603 [Leptomonas seymouri]